MKENSSRGYFIPPSKREGSGHWLLQRLSGIVLVFLSFWFIANLFIHITADYAVAFQWVSSPLNAGLLGIFLLALLYHSYLGMEVIIDDYVHMAFWYSAALFLLRAVMLAGLLCIILSFYWILF